MATKDISDLQVVKAYAEMHRQMDSARGTIQRFEHADDILKRMTGQHPKVCERAMERAYERGLVEYGMWLRGGWLTDDGKALLSSNVQGHRRCAALSRSVRWTAGLGVTLDRLRTVVLFDGIGYAL